MRIHKLSASNYIDLDKITSLSLESESHDSFVCYNTVIHLGGDTKTLHRRDSWETGAALMKDFVEVIWKGN